MLILQLLSQRQQFVVSAESLESRTLLTTMFYVDFGTALPAAGLSTTVEDFRDIDGAGTNGFGTGSDLQGWGGLGNSDQLDFNPVQYDFNGDSVVDAADYTVYRDQSLYWGPGDYQQWAAAYGSSATSASGSASAPEPSTVVIGLMGLVSLLSRRVR